MPGANLKAKTSPWLSHTGCFVKQNQSFTPLLLLPEAMNRLLKEEKLYKLVLTHNSQCNLQSFGSSQGFPPWLAPGLLSCPSPAPHPWQVQGIPHSDGEEFSTCWIGGSQEFIFFNFYIFFLHITFPNCSVEISICVSWSPLEDLFRRLQIQGKGGKGMNLDRTTDLKENVAFLPSLYTSLLSLKNTPAPLHLKLTSVPWAAQVMWTQTWSVYIAGSMTLLFIKIEPLQKIVQRKGHSKPVYFG